MNRRLTGLALALGNFALAMLASGLLVLLLGEDPLSALALLVTGAFGDAESLCYTLYYATSFVFGGLAVAVALEAGLFNIGGEGQATLGGLGTALVCLALPGWPLWAAAPLAIAAAALFGAAWAFIPGYLQARRGSPVVVTTIMFNMIASALLGYLLVRVMSATGQQSPQSPDLARQLWLPTASEIAGRLGWQIGPAPLNLSLLLALACCVGTELLLFRSAYGYELRVLGQSEKAARYGGVPVARRVIGAMLISGALAGCIGINEVMGAQHRLMLNFVGGAGFVGLAVALMGRCRPLGILAAAILFGALTQGGGELALEKPAISREMVVVIQGLVILFCGALDRMPLSVLARLRHRQEI
jgi:ABC-type uncharacterized transport system permease subunit